MKALYAGSFDPPTLGHGDIICRAAQLFDEVVVGVGLNPKKTPHIPLEQRLDLLRLEYGHLAPIQVATFHGATVHFAREIGAQVLVRGLRSYADFNAERGMAEINRRHGIETLFLLAETVHTNLSSSLVRQVLAAGLSLDGLVSPAVEQVLRDLDKQG